MSSIYARGAKPFEEILAPERAGEAQRWDEIAASSWSRSRRDSGSAVMQVRCRYSWMVPLASEGVQSSLPLTEEK